MCIFVKKEQQKTALRKVRRQPGRSPRRRCRGRGGAHRARTRPSTRAADTPLNPCRGHAPQPEPRTPAAPPALCADAVHTSAGWVRSMNASRKAGGHRRRCGGPSVPKLRLGANAESTLQHLPDLRLEAKVVSEQGIFLWRLGF